MILGFEFLRYPPMKTIIFKVTSWSNFGLWRRIECTHSQTLGDLHQAIQSAFELDNDHLYSFFLNNQAWDLWFDYGGPGTNRVRYHAVDAVLGDLPLKINKRFLYLFDFGDELRYEVKVVGEGLVDSTLSYPRLIDGEGMAPPQYDSFDEDSNEHSENARHGSAPHADGCIESVPAHPGLQALVPVVRRCLKSHFQRRHPELDVEEIDEFYPAAKDCQPATLQEEHEAALAVVEQSGGDMMLIHSHIEHAVDDNVWNWLGDLPRDLSDEGHHADAVSLADRLVGVWPNERISNDLPLMLARTGDQCRATLAVDRNLAEFPDDTETLISAGQALEILGENERAVTVYRDALAWAGAKIDRRDEIVSALIALLERMGRVDTVEQVKQAERQMRLEFQQAMAPSPKVSQTFRRDKPKVGRNDPCPCGSGKKHKKCCG
jgi:tetratricopeptide (TPR) repeat protein